LFFHHFLYNDVSAVRLAVRKYTDKKKQDDHFAFHKNAFKIKNVLPGLYYVLP